MECDCDFRSRGDLGLFNSGDLNLTALLHRKDDIWLKFSVSPPTQKSHLNHDHDREIPPHTHDGPRWERQGGRVDEVIYRVHEEQICLWLSVQIITTSLHDVHLA